jgi:hypothetical protein
MTLEEAQDKAWEVHELREQAAGAGEFGQDFLADAAEIEQELQAAGYDDIEALLKD